LRPRVSSNPPEEYIDGETVPGADDHTDVDDTEYEALEPDEDGAPAAAEVSIPIMVEPSQPSAAMQEAPIDLTRPRVKPERSEPTPLSSVAVAETIPLARSSWTYAAVLAAAAGVVWLALEARSASPPAPVASAVETHAVPVPPPRVAPSVTFSDLAADAGFAPGEGLLELALGAEAPIKIDGAPQGRGPKLSVPLRAGTHEVLLGAEDKPRTVEIRAGKKTRLDVPEAP
jgi:hypothetical protein